MTNAEIIAAVERWQTDPRLHPVTCGQYSQKHAPLKPVEKGGEVILECPNCEHWHS